jgi:hypothetical protein
MRITRLVGVNVYLGIVALAATLLGMGNHAHARTVNGIDDPDRVPGAFIVLLKRDHILSLNNPVLTSANEIATKSAKWQAAKAAVDTEVAQMVGKLAKGHPDVRISSVLSEGKAPGFVLKASDEEAKAIANEDDVAEVDVSVRIKNVTSTNNQTPALSWGLQRIDHLPTGVDPV